MIELFVGFLTGLCVYFIVSGYLKSRKDKTTTNNIDSTTGGGGVSEAKSPPKK